MTENLANLPVWMWCGEDDRMMPGMEALRDSIARTGPAPVFTSTPGVGHQYLSDKQEPAINWLQQHTRKRPDRFTFIADTSDHLGIWGITMKRDLAVSGLPRFTCRIENQAVKIDTQGTPEIRIDLGDGGLGLTGEVSVVLNGQTAYKGPPASITLPTTPD